MKPKFRRQDWWAVKRVGEKWRRPRGIDSKMRLKKKGKPPLVSVGYRSPKTARNLHPSGKVEILVRNMKDLEKADPARNVVRIASGAGLRLRLQIAKKAAERGIRVLNQPKEEKR
ncbi:MAG: 50S ribosomal protein L32e [Candidatus Hadarchaeales archaeon]